MKKTKFIIIFLLLLISFSSFSVYAAGTQTININPTGKSISASGEANGFTYELDKVYIMESHIMWTLENFPTTYTVSFYDDKGSLINSLNGVAFIPSTTSRSNFAPGQRVKSFKVYATGTVSTPFVPKISAEIFYKSIEEPKPPAEAFKLVGTNKDYDNNKYKFVFNKDFTVNIADIEFKDSEGNAVAFTHSISNKELIITPSKDLETGTYTIKVKKVKSTDNEELTNITPLTLLIQSNFYVTNKDFSNFLSTDTKELNLSFNKNLVVNTITMGDLTVTKTVDGNKLKINLPALAEEKSYPLSINVTSIDNEKLSLSYSLSTKSITGNKDLDKLLLPILQMFEVAKVNGKVLVIIAIGVGVIFISAMWLWGKAKSWLKSV